MNSGEIGSGLKIDYDVNLVTRTPFYFGPPKKQLLGWLHSVDSAPRLDVVVVLCTPIGMEYMSSYRSYRYIADYFALAGFTVVRFDYHGIGDSSGLNDDGNRLDDWLWSIEQACKAAREITGLSKIGLVGLRMGASMAAIISEKVELEFLVLWAALEDGRRFIREVRALQLTGTSQTGQGETELIEAGGIAYWQETVDSINKIKLAELTPKSKRVLIIPRDDLPSTNSLQTSWSIKNVQVEQKELPGSSKMLLVALETVVPHESIVEIVNWARTGLAKHNVNDNSKLDSLLSSMEVLPELSGSEKQPGDIKESIVWFGEDNNLFSILSEPNDKIDPDLPVILIVNSGANHRVGPSRLYVTLARILSGNGFRCMRMDVPGLGDSFVGDRNKENIEYIQDASEIIEKAMTYFESIGESNNYILTGLCSGAYFSFHAALDLAGKNIKESILINPLTFYWYEGIEFDSSGAKNFGYWNWYKKAIKDPRSWKKFFLGGINYKSLYQTIINRIKIVISAKFLYHLTERKSSGENEGHKNDLNRDLKQIAENGTKLTFILADSDPGYDILMTSAGITAKKLIKAGNITIHTIKGADHTFSKYKPRSDALDTICNHIEQSYQKK